MFRKLDELVEAARVGGPVLIAVAAGQDPDAIEALKTAEEIGLAKAIFVGDAERIRRLAEAAEWYIGGEQIIHVADDQSAARKAIALVRDGTAALLMKGKIKTSALIHAVLDRETGLRAGRLLSQVIVFQVPGWDRLM